MRVAFSSIFKQFRISDGQSSFRKIVTIAQNRLQCAKKNKETCSAYIKCVILRRINSIVLDKSTNNF